MVNLKNGKIIFPLSIIILCSFVSCCKYKWCYKIVMKNVHTFWENDCLLLKK